MATGGLPANDLKEFECSICYQVFWDPRLLPCGHMFCGPSKRCLTRMCNDFGKIKCAICSAEHMVSIDDLTPMYGMREAFENMRKLKFERLSLSDSNEKYPPCDQHVKKECYHWCNDCNEAVCKDCIELNHKGCNLKLMKYVLSSLVSDALGRLPLLHGKEDLIATNLKIASTEVADCKKMLRKYEAQKKLMEFLLQVANSAFSNNDLQILAKIGNGESVDRDYSIVSKLLKILKKDKLDIISVLESHNLCFMIDVSDILSSCNSVKVCFSPYTLIYQFFKFAVSCCLHEKNSLSLYLHMKPLSRDFQYPEHELRYRFILHNWKCDSRSVRRELAHKFSDSGKGYGWPQFIQVKKICQNRDDWLRNGKLCVLVKICHSLSRKRINANMQIL